MVDTINLQYPPEIVQYYSPNYVWPPAVAVWRSENPVFWAGRYQGNSVGCGWYLYWNTTDGGKKPNHYQNHREGKWQAIGFVFRAIFQSPKLFRHFHNKIKGASASQMVFAVDSVDPRRSRCLKRWRLLTPRAEVPKTWGIGGCFFGGFSCGKAFQMDHSFGDNFMVENHLAQQKQR